MDQPTPSKAARSAEFHRRLDAAPAAQDFEEAYGLVCDLLNQVEDELTAIPFDPSRWRTDGRMYPPQRDRMSVDPSVPGVIILRSRRHSTRIARNGAVEIRDSADRIVCSKLGADGQSLGGLSGI